MRLVRYFGWSVCIIIFTTSVVFAGPLAGTEFEQTVRDQACSDADLEAASERLQALRDADQLARSGGSWTEDLPRRIEVAEIYASGCLQRAQDFHHAALIFQHGTMPEHFYQAWFFAERAVALGDEEAKWLIPRAIDRYMLNLGYKQLFGTNSVTPSDMSEATVPSTFFCLWPVEDSFSDEQRVEYGITPLKEKKAEVLARIPDEASFEGPECPFEVPSPPKGAFPGIW